MKKSKKTKKSNRFEIKVVEIDFDDMLTDIIEETVKELKEEYPEFENDFE